MHDRPPRKAMPPGNGDDTVPGSLSPARVRQLFAEQDDARVLRVLEDGDPIKLLVRCGRWTRRHAMLLDERMLLLLSRARIVLLRSALDADQDVDEWFDDRISQAAEAMLAFERGAVTEGTALTRPLAPHYVFLAKTLGLELRELRKASAVLNGLNEDVRRAFYHMMYMRESVADYAKQIGMDSFYTKTLLRRALLAVSTMNDPRHDPFADGG